jgi:KDO2-lipid IV(A) lauroyltransferase
VTTLARATSQVDAGTRDLREGGVWTASQKLKNDLVYAAIASALAVARALPEGAFAPLGRALARIAYHAVPHLRRIADANVARALPERSARERARLVREAYRELGSHLGATLARLAASDSARRSALRGAHAPTPPATLLPFPEDDRARLREALAEGRGVVFASAHLGPWEQVAATLVGVGFPLVTLARGSYDPRLTRLYDDVRAANGVRAIYREAPHAALAIVRALRRGHVLGIPMDLRTRASSIPVPFLGADAPTAVGPARIALRTRAPVVVGTATRDHNGALTITTTRIPTSDLGARQLPDARAEDEWELTRRINAELSRRIRAYPEGWVWMHERFAADASRGASMRNDSDAPAAPMAIDSPSGARGEGTQGGLDPEAHSRRDDA